MKNQKLEEESKMQKGIINELQMKNRKLEAESRMQKSRIDYLENELKMKSQKYEAESRMQKSRIDYLENEIKMKNESDLEIKKDKCVRNDDMTVFVKNIPYSTTAKELADFMIEKFGEIKDVRILQEKHEGKSYSRGFGFVEFESFESYNKAINMRNIGFESRTLTIEKVKIELETIFLDNLPEGTTDHDIQDALKKLNITKICLEQRSPSEPAFALVDFKAGQTNLKKIAKMKINFKGSQIPVMLARPFEIKSKLISTETYRRRAPFIKNK